MVQFFVQLNISAIYNCTLSTEINSYFLAPEFNCVPIFRPYVTSSHDDVRLHSKFILGSLSELLSHDEVDELLQLTVSEMTSFLEAFECSTTSSSHAVHCLNSVFSLAEAVLSLNSLLVNDKNCEMIIAKNVVPALFTLLACGSISEQISGCQLIWNLLLSPKYGLKFKQQLMELSMEDCLRIFLESKSNNLSLLSSCLLFLLDSDGVKGIFQTVVTSVLMLCVSKYACLSLIHIPIVCTSCVCIIYTHSQYTHIGIYQYVCTGCVCIYQYVCIGCVCIYQYVCTRYVCIYRCVYKYNICSGYL